MISKLGWFKIGVLVGVYSLALYQMINNGLPFFLIMSITNFFLLFMIFEGYCNQEKKK
jgi:hypothetical protein